MALVTGDKVPEVSLQNTEGKFQSLYEYLGEDKTVLLFFPFAFSGVCTEEICTVRDNMKLYKALNANIIGISIDSFFTLRAFKKSLNLNFRLLSDFNREAVKAFDCMYEDYFGLWGVAKRSVFVADREGYLLHQEILEDSDMLPDYQEIQQVLSR